MTFWTKNHVNGLVEHVIASAGQRANQMEYIIVIFSIQNADYIKNTTQDPRKQFQKSE